MTPFVRKVVVVFYAALLLFVAVAPSQAETAKPPYKPYSGQSGKDVIWVPTPQALVDRMLDMAKLTDEDYLVDLGSGDGRTVIAAAKRGVRAHGVEYNAKMVALAEFNAKREGASGLATFERADIFQSDFSKATVVTLFLLPEINLRLRPILLDMKPGTRIVSNSFHMAEWQPDEAIDAGGDCEKWCRAYKWIVPAKVDGRWRIGGGELRLTQTFQWLAGELTEDDKVVPLSEARLNGADIMFTAAGKRYYGRVDGPEMVGAIDGAQKFTARRM
ncbi:MAG: cyclopropane-fatty-acyl-phospholipid synthase family protein [Rhodospirillaceae bacterium]